MSTHCASCGEAFVKGDKIQQLPPILELREGEKSGELGWYPVPNSQTDVVHIECVQGYYQIEDTKEDEFDDDTGLVCMECLERMDYEEIQDMFTELMTNLQNNPNRYLQSFSYQELYDLYIRFGNSLTAMSQQTQS
jgi:hypothetical protein